MERERISSVEGGFLNEKKETEKGGSLPRVLFFANHPVHYQPFPAYNRHRYFSFLVVFSSLMGVEEGYDREFRRRVGGDETLIQGFPWIEIPPLKLFSSLFFWIGKGGWDAVVFLTGYKTLSFWLGIALCKLFKIPVLFGTDAITLKGREGGGWKRYGRKLLWRFLFSLADEILLPTPKGKELFLSLGFPPDKITVTPYVVPEREWLMRKETLVREKARKEMGLKEDEVGVLFVGKLVPWKRPLDCLLALKDLSFPWKLFYIGDGELKERIVEEVERWNLKDRVVFVGYLPPSILPLYYRGGDILVLPSSYEPFGVVVLEGILMGVYPIVSEEVGAGVSLFPGEEFGSRFPVGDLKTLREKLLWAFLHKKEREEKVKGGVNFVLSNWSSEVNARSLLSGIEKAIERKKRRDRAM